MNVELAARSRSSRKFGTAPTSRALSRALKRVCDRKVIESFVRHYASLGFQRLLLYLDDPEDFAAEVLRSGGWAQRPSSSHCLILLHSLLFLIIYIHMCIYRY